MLSKERGKYFQEKWDEMEYKFANMEMKQQIDQLTNNWNELEEWLESNWKDTQDIWYVKIINKMNKIKDGNNVSDRN